MITQYSHGINTEAKPSNNVIDIYKKWSAEEIRAALQPNRMPLVNICINLDHGFNVGSIIRASNCFLAKETYVVGRKRFDRRGAVGSTHVERVYHADNFDEVLETLRPLGYSIFAVDNIPEYNPQNIFDADIQMKSAFVYGSECDGLPQEIIDECDEMIYIRQDGSIRSLNVAQAAACVCCEYSRRYRMKGSYALLQD